MRDYLFGSRFSESIGHGESTENRFPKGIKYDRPADLHVFNVHVTSVERRSMLSLPVISEGNRRTVVAHRSVFLPYAKRDINTFYL